MSLKDEYLAQAREARVEHKKWVNQIRLIVSGLENDKDKIVLNASDSPFGTWLYSKAMAYNISNSALVLSEIEHLFDECYNEYHKIYALLFKAQGGGIIGSIFGSTKASSSDYKIASQCYESLLEKSDKLLGKLRIFENQLNATNSEKFENALSNEGGESLQIEVKQESNKPKEQRYYRGSLIED
ncbi:MAG: hypothetical protein JXQ67_01075 [Campylobacterales bacterium]|nr:hypothetical protein [Campylobacterales bacterium]